MKHVDGRPWNEKEKGENVMTAKEAIDELKGLKATTENMNQAIGGFDESVEALALAIAAIEKQDEYEERMKPVKVDEDYCPLCRTYGKDDNDVPGDYCPNCGQYLDWMVEE